MTILLKSNSHNISWLSFGTLDANVKGGRGLGSGVSSLMKSKIKSYQDLEVWQKAPSARYCHPCEEHLLPLHVCLGMSEQGRHNDI